MKKIKINGQKVLLLDESDIRPNKECMALKNLNTKLKDLLEANVVIGITKNGEITVIKNRYGRTGKI